LVDLLQSNFIPNRDTYDNALIAQEIVHYGHKRKSKFKSLLFKIDFEITYDRVDCDFFHLTLEEFDSCTPIRDLRYRDPMSPYLFVLCMEKLVLLVQEKVYEDCLLFTKASSSQVQIVKQVQEEFSHASGLKTNIQKSLFHASKNVSQNCPNSLLLLGFMVLKIWKGILDFLYSKEGVEISCASCDTLVQSILIIISIYTKQNYWLLEATCNQIDASILRNRPFGHWISWNTITKPKVRGGLGIRQTKNANVVILSKHILGEGLRVQLGKGNVSMWYANWLEDGPLCELDDIIWSSANLGIYTYRFAYQ
ncbi:hypothetical protein CR513_43675, partial [Mucuna pruriens]